MTALKERLKRLIAASGPITVSDYMAACLFDPEAGYYTTREPFGVAGDFTTAPEISQMFGELVAVWVYSAWIAMGKPVPVTLVEIGPGRGTLMADMLRTLDRLDPAFVVLVRIALVEASPRLAELQRQKLAKGGRAKPRWFATLSQVPASPVIIVANELFDAIPVRQFVKLPDGWRERLVGLDESGELCFVAGPHGIDDAILPPAAADAPFGAIFEAAPAREALMDEIATRIRASGGAGLFIDYGHVETDIGDTLQAVRQHAYDDVLAHPGEADLTSHVDFAALAAVATAIGLNAMLATQGELLLRLGIVERAGVLGASRSEEARERLREEVERLAGPDRMGSLFKALAIAPKDVPLASLLPAH